MVITPVFVLTVRVEVIFYNQTLDVVLDITLLFENNQLFHHFLLGWKEVFSDGITQQRNKFQQGVQSSSKYWSHKPSSSKD